jgi:autotransporter-associated beta strand protein
LVVNAVISGTGGIIKDGDGNMVLQGATANTYTGGTTINAGTLTLSKTAGTNAIASGTVTVNSGGTLLMGASNQMAAGVNINLAGGTLNTAGFSDVLGTLTLSGSSTMDMGAGAGIFQFAGASSFSGGTLLIQNWNGWWNVGGGPEQILFSGSGFSVGLAPQISFNYGGTIYGGQFINRGGGVLELIPVIPEPSTWVAGLLLASFGAGAAWRRSRRR